MKHALFCLAPLLAAAVASVAATEPDLADRAYGEDPAQRLDCYLPEEPEAAPIMVYVHGGGWRRGSKDRVGRKADHFTGRGWIFVSIDYRLLPEGRHPRNVEDVAAALAWVERELPARGGDPARVFVMGHSAGAHLAALVATDGRRLRAAGSSPALIKGVIALDTQAYDLPGLVADSPSPLYRQVFGDEADGLEDASPLHHVHAGADIPPFVIAWSRGSGPRVNRRRSERARAFAAALERAGVEATLIDGSDRDHREINRRFGDPDDARVTGAAMAAIERILADTADPAPRPPAVADPRRWTPSLVFTADPETVAAGRPLPVNAMNLAVHDGSLYCGMATSFERDRHSRASSYVYRLDTAGGEWVLDADFGPGSSRVGALAAVRFVTDATGTPIPGGPIERLVAFTMQLDRRRERVPAVRVRDDATGRWLTLPLPLPAVGRPNVRALALHRDAVTGADLLLVGASPAPLGIVAGAYDAAVPGGIRWSPHVEVTAAAQRGASKWFGIASVGGAALAGDARYIFRRSDGEAPRWRRVATVPDRQDVRGAAVRGLTAIANRRELTGWPEAQHLLFGGHGALWRMRVPADPTAGHPAVAEYVFPRDASAALDEQVLFGEGPFNPIPTVAGPGGEPRQLIGCQLVFGVPGRRPRRDDPSSYRLDARAWLLHRDRHARYRLEALAAADAAERRLFLARDVVASPFAGEEGVIYACGFNGSYFKGSLGTAWVYRGERVTGRP